MEDQAKSLQQRRSQLKRDLTLTANKISTTIQRNTPLSTVPQLFQDLDNVFHEFTATHLEYSDIIDSDDTLEGYKVVNKLDLDGYFNAAKSVYDASTACIIEYEHSFYKSEVTCLERQLDRVISDVDYLVTELESKVTSIGYAGNVLDVFCEEANKVELEVNSVMAKLKELYVKLSQGCSEPTTCVSKVEECIGRLRRKLVWAKTLTLSIPGSNTQSMHSDQSPILSSRRQTSVQTSASAPCSFSTSPINTANAGSIETERTKTQTAINLAQNENVDLTGSNAATSLSITAAYLGRSSNGQSHIPFALGHPVTGQQPEKCHFLKAPLPTFSGTRSEWGEFRAIWQLHGAKAYSSETDRAWALKQCLGGKALEHVKAIYITQPRAYERIWGRLDSIYSDVSMSVQQAYDDLKKIKAVKEEDMKSLITFVNAVENCYSQLGEVHQLGAITMTHIDDLCDLLPFNVRKEWMKKYHSLSESDKIHPFMEFMLFLESERDIAIRLSERKVKATYTSEIKIQNLKPTNTLNATATRPPMQSPLSSCLIHASSNVKHKTEQCYQFTKMTINERKELLTKHKACFRCFEAHMRKDCPVEALCQSCNKGNHHKLLCSNLTNSSNKQEEHASKGEGTDHCKAMPQGAASQTSTITCHTEQSSESVSLFAIQRAKVVDSDKYATLFFDSGSNTTYITHNAAKKLRAQELGNVTLSIVAMGNIESKYETKLYSVYLETTSNSVVHIKAYGMKEITGPVSPIDMKTVNMLFPHRKDLGELQRRSGHVDLLIGSDYLGFHPKNEIDSAGNHLSIMEGPFGKCLQGSHCQLKEQTSVLTNMSAATTHVCRSKELVLDKFIQAEQMGTETIPKCGGCKCGKCPIRGHSYSFKEEQELNLIRDNLSYNSEQHCWTAKYPWVINPDTLPNNYKTVLATLRSTEKVLQKQGKEWSKTYCSQIQDMVDRGVARKLTEKDLQNWNGPVFYISHLAVKNAKSMTTPVRIVFNSSQRCNGTSLNEALAKGPDCYMNNLLGILMRWREKPAVLIGDIKKMFNSVHIDELEQHCHRFLWRDLDVDRAPDIYVITRVNMGDKPAPAISAEAILKTACLFEDAYPSVSKLLKTSMYVDDIVESVESIEEAKTLSVDTEHVLCQGGFKVKGWIFSGDKSDKIRVLGVQWDPVEDNISFEISSSLLQQLNYKLADSDSTMLQIPRPQKLMLSRRAVLEQVMRIYDPLGILSPFVVVAKILLRQTWELRLGWDDPLPSELYNKWITYFKDMSRLGGLTYDRCTTPSNSVGQPSLIIFSDASDKAYGYAAYIRWKCSDGTYWCRLVLAKSRVAPIRKLSTPQLELNGAVLSKRGRCTIETETRDSFEKVYHLTDSETVLCMLNKLSTRFKLYEGVRIGEIQAATNGNMSEWYWIKGSENCSDWVTRGLSPEDLVSSSEWWTGPRFLYKPESDWGIKSYSEVKQVENPLPGEKKLTVTMNTQSSTISSSTLIDYTRFSSAKKLLWVVARLKAIFRLKSFKGGKTVNVSVQDVNRARQHLIQDTQKEMSFELQKTHNGKYKSLKPIRDHDEMWVVGCRLAGYNPMTSLSDERLPVLLPNMHPYTRLLMKEAHKLSGHRGRDITLARFRMTYWTPQGTKLAKAIVNDCHMCRLKNPKLIAQKMGQLPPERLVPTLPFTHVMVDFFGPYLVRGEVQKRTSGKAYGVIFTDMVSRAVHIEPCYGYDTSSFLMTLKRFTSIRGWPKTMYSDPGSQLVHASKELQSIWKSVDKKTLLKCSTDNGLRWVFGPADSPWYQGAVETLVKSAKHCLKYSIGTQRLSVPEFSTICYETASLLNERPLGRIPSEDSDITILTPNCLLLGRATSSAFDCANTDTATSCKIRLGLVNLVAERFWQKWTELYAPTLMKQTKWTKHIQNVQVGDIVAVCDSNALRSQYFIAEVQDTFPDKEGVVRKVELRYKNHKVGESVKTYSGAPDTTVMRSVQRLALLVPVNTQ